MIGLKSISAVAVTIVLIGAAYARGALGLDHLAHLSAAACFMIGLVASLVLGLVAAGWRPEQPSRTALAFAGLRPMIVEDATPRELPAAIQRVLLFSGFASIAIVALSNHAAAKITNLPTEMGAPSPSQFCLPEKPVDKAAPAPPPPVIDQPGCALVRRAFKLGYAKTLGACAPRQAVVAEVSPAAKREVCTRRQLDEPLLHYGYRRISGALGHATSVDPVQAVEHRVSDLRTHVDYVESLLADIHHAITGSPHAAHHLWVNLPDPHPGSLRDRFTGAPRCSTRYANLMLWPTWTESDQARVVEHVFGQLLFATRFGSTASCNDYVIHWDAPIDACARLAANPVQYLDSEGALKSVRAVLDRRRRLLEVAQLAKTLGRNPPAPPPPVSSIVSLSCFIVDPLVARSPIAPGPSGKPITIDGDEVGLRESHVLAIRPTGDGPLDVYIQLSTLLGGPDTTIVDKREPVPRPEDVTPEDFMLTRLDPLADADPFRGARWPLAHPELVELYPFERHLHAFIETFRRRYLAQRGRL
ncbi:MAG: hypothetical protein JWO36_3559 [Myxococcales bacterium]|nr:hypothetical protein [Myxococcales bacterium]